MLSKFFDHRLILHSLGPAVTHEAQVKEVDVALISWAVYPDWVANNFVAQGISVMKIKFYLRTNIINRYFNY